MPVKLFHNARCVKSRQAYAIITAKGIEVQVINYLKHPPSEKELKQLLKLLGINAEALVRKTELLYKTQYRGKLLSEKQWLTVLSKNPVLIERPIVVNGNKAVIGRQPEKITAFLSKL